ncbi:MAG: SusD/RagB family nutrient-binding outer membrane lipoprotein [Moheibacter sp.]
MKKYILTILSLAFIIGCSDEDYADLNIDPVNPSEVPAGFLFANSTKAMFDQMLNTSVNRNVFRLFSQYWTECQYTNETNYDIKNRSIPDTHWGIIYRDVLFDLKNAKELVGQQELSNTFTQEVKDNQIAIITIVEVYAWQQMVDTFGNIPYSEALMGSENVTPVYDDAYTIYTDLITKIRSAYSSLDTSAEGFGEDQDIVYGDNISNWKKLAASIKLKIAMRLADKYPSVAQDLAEEAILNGLISSHTENFSLHYENNNVNAHPLYADLYLSGRQDFVPANTYVDYLNDLEDPRRTVFFDGNLVDDDNNVYYDGGIYGSLNTYTNYTHIGAPFYEADLVGVLMNYTEIEFLLAEAAERMYAGSGDAATHYHNAITSNMEYWGIASDDITEYLSRTNVNYSTAPGTWKQKIGKQFWIAMYDRGFEGWTVWRKYDAPTLNLPTVTGNNVPVRFTYPAEEQTLNSTNYLAASSAIGADLLYTKLFWDVN